MLGYRVYGTGHEIVVVLHEWLGDHTNWDSVLPFLDPDRARYLLVDLRGYGLSRHLSGSYVLDEAGGDILDLLGSFACKRFHIVCHSMSALVGQWLAQAAPARVQGLFMISRVTASGFKMDEATFGRLLAAVDQDEAALAAISARTGSRYSNGWLKRKLAMARQSAVREAMVGYARMFTSSDISKAAAGLKLPVMVMTGQYDIPIYSDASVRDHFGALYPNIRFFKCQEAGHYSMLEAPVITASEIENFIASVST